MSNTELRRIQVIAAIDAQQAGGMAADARLIVEIRASGEIGLLTGVDDNGLAVLLMDRMTNERHVPFSILQPTGMVYDCEVPV